MVYIGNAFSLQMIDTTKKHKVIVKPITKDEVDAIMYDNQYTSCIGHQDTAAVLDSMLEEIIECNRINVSLTKDDVLIVAQILGGRLPEGTTCLPDNFSLTFLHVSLDD